MVVTVRLATIKNGTLVLRRTPGPWWAGYINAEAICDLGCRSRVYPHVPFTIRQGKLLLTVDLYVSYLWPF